MGAAIALGHSPTIAQQLPSQGQHAPRPTNPTYLPPTVFSETNDGISFALVPHMEAYHINRQAVVALWFRMSKPEVRGFAARTGLILSVLDPHGVALQVSQPMSERSEIWVQNRTVAIMNGDAFDVDLTDLYMLSVPGKYTVTATIVLFQNGVKLTAPPISISVQN
jgi:hypothetical protein